MTDIAARRDNARKLARKSRDTADRYLAAGSPRMSQHHATKAAEWGALADTLDEQIAFENPMWTPESARRRVGGTFGT